VPTFESNGVQINYVDDGSGPPVVLVHGFAASLAANWRAPGVMDALLAAERRVVALDCRGHGQSGKPHDPGAYGGTAMADDVVALIDHLGIERTDLAGYSMGGQIAATLLVTHPQRWSRVVLAGVGDWIFGERRDGQWQALISGLDAPNADVVTDPRAKAFRIFAEATGNDLKALVAVQSASRRQIDRAELARVRTPVLVLLGVDDTLVGTGQHLAAAIPGAKLVTVPGDHLSAVAKPEFRQAIAGFLSGELAASG
jgi:pimeloyl-ACP methyl ester carboxylesterase